MTTIEKYDTIKSLLGANHSWVIQLDGWHNNTKTFAFMVNHIAKRIYYSDSKYTSYFSDDIFTEE